MNNKIIIFVLSLILSMGSDSLIAQSNLAFGSSGVQHEDTLHIGDSIHFDFWLVNQGNSTINDSTIHMNHSQLNLNYQTLYPVFSAQIKLDSSKAN